MATRAKPSVALAPKAGAQQTELVQRALQELRVIGGQLIVDDEITFEGRRFVFPEQFRGDLPGLGRFVSRYIEGQEEQVNVVRTYDYRPFDGAHATFQCLKKFFGYAQSKARQGMFGSQPPQEVTVPIGYQNGKLVQHTVPWGDMVLPGLKNSTLSITMSHNPEKGELFRLVATVRRADKAVIDGFFDVVGEFLEQNSIYRRHAVWGNMDFFDTDAVDPSMFVYDEEVWAQVETNILSPMQHTAVLRDYGLSPKRVVLLEGRYGTGKSGLGRTAAKVAVSNGWTAITARSGIDDPFAVLQTAKLYQPAMVFIEDVDTFSDNMDPGYVTKLLDRFDGFGTKDVQMLLVLTTNHADRIHKGMLRPGRLDAVIHLGDLDRPGVEKLTKLVVKEALDPDIDFDAVHAATDGFTPAFVKEALERAVRFTIARTGEVGAVSTADLVHTCNSLRAQLALQEAASDSHEKLPPLDQMMRSIVKEMSNGDPDTIHDAIESKLNGAIVVRDGARWAQIMTTD